MNGEMATKVRFKTSANFLTIVRGLNETNILSSKPELSECFLLVKNSSMTGLINSCTELLDSLSNETIFGAKTERNGRSFADDDRQNFRQVVFQISSQGPDRENAIPPNEEPRDRSKKSTSSHVIEMAVFVDEDLYATFREVFELNMELEERIIDVVMALITSVDILFSDQSLDSRLEISVKRIEIFKRNPQNLETNLDVDAYLNNFCKWQNDENSSRKEVHWDHALMLTGLDLQSTSEEGQRSSQVVGLSPISGMCDPASSCSVIEGKSFESVFVIAHELGHSLGMRHDGRADLNDCDPGGFLMSPTLSGSRNSWSSCSNKYLKRFLRSPESSCLDDNSGGQQLRDEGKLPGESFDSDMQCQLRYGADSQHSRSQNSSDVCRDLHCVRDHFTWTSHPALEGTRCGNGRWCRRGDCVARRESFKTSKKFFPEPISASVTLTSSTTASRTTTTSASSTAVSTLQWSDLIRSSSSCVPSCMSGRFRGSSWLGIRVLARKCRSRRKIGSGKETCAGDFRRFLLCFAEKDCISRDHRSNLADFVSSSCSVSSRRNPDLILPIGVVDENDSTCRIKCFGHRANEIVETGEVYPDGTTCGEHSYCVDGVCEEFSCSTQSRFQLDQEDCQISTAANLQTTPYDPNWSSWWPASNCRHSCLLPSHGLRFVVRNCSTTSCQGLEKSIQTCQDQLALDRCSTQAVTTAEFASHFCAKIQSSHLSGFGGQLKSVVEDPDRSCKVACQDRFIQHRFYIAGQFPTGTMCGENGLCLQGKCLDLGHDGTPLYQMSLIRSEFGKFWRKKRDLRLEPPTRISGSIDQRHLSRILDELNRTNFEFERSEEFKNFVKNPIDIDVAFVECLQKSFRTSQSSSSALLTSSTSSQMMFLFSLYFPIMILFVFVWKKLLC